MNIATRRLAQVRDFMSERNLEALVIKNIADLQWLCCIDGVFDDERAHTALITADAAYLHTDSRYYHAFLDAFAENPDAAALWQLDMESLSAPAWVARQLGRITGLSRIAVEDSLELFFYDSLKEELSKVGLQTEPARLHNDIAEFRKVKTSDELELLKCAQKITDAAFTHICTFIKAGMTEHEVCAELEYYMRAHGSEGVSFDSIVAAGPNGANPHARPSDYVIAPGDLVVLDYGAIYKGYHADMTRTVAVGEPGAEKRQVYDIVRRAHEEAAAAIHAGVIGADIDAVARTIIYEAGYEGCFGHSLGHGVGLEIHELPSLSARYTKALPSGAVVTVEPGIYLPGRFGIRLEDTGVVREEGYESFMASTHDLVIVG